MRFIATLAASVVAAIGVASPALAQEHEPGTNALAVEVPSRWEKAGCKVPSQEEWYRPQLDRTFKFWLGGKGGDFRALPIKSRAIKTLRRYVNCSRTAKLERRRWHAVKTTKRTWRWFAYIDRITPYGEWAIPPYIVYCESSFRGIGAFPFWGAQNPSGAIGPYQLLGKGAPWPASTPWAMSIHHKIAAGLWAGGTGAHHWVCA